MPLTSRGNAVRMLNSEPIKLLPQCRETRSTFQGRLSAPESLPPTVEGVL